MTYPDPESPKSRAAGGQVQRMPGATREISLHDQLYRYAEDLQQMIERQGSLEADYEKLNETCQRLNESRAMLDEMIRCSRDIHIVTDAVGIILQSNPAAESISARLAGQRILDWVLPDFREKCLALQERAFVSRPGEREEVELRFRREQPEQPDQPPLIVMAQVLPVSKQQGEATLNWILRDVTQQREVEFETRLSSIVFKSATEGVMITDVTGEILAVNPAFTKITGYSAEEVVGKNPRILSSGVQDGSFYQEFWRALRERGSWQGEVYNRKKSGEVYPEWLTVNAVKDENGNTLTYLAVFTDLSRLLLAEKRLSYLAHHDSLTGLPNRLLFQDRLTQTLTQARRSGVPFTVIFIDLDRFKQINDMYGHAVGDVVLQEAAKRLSGSVREADTVARLGGDEFVILAPMLSGKADIGNVCAKAIHALVQPIHAGEIELFIGGSFGCAEYPIHGEDEATLLKHADLAMYRAKGMGGNAYFIHGDDAGMGGVSQALP